MKKIIFLATILCGLASQIINAQLLAKPLPEITSIAAYQLEIGFNTTTVLIFPVGIISADRGVNDIIIQKEKDIDNVLKVKAASKDFIPTNLHVYTTDGKVYAFRVQYTDRPSQTTFDLKKLSDTITSNPPLLTAVPPSTSELKLFADSVRKNRRMFSRQTNAYDMRLRLRSIRAVKGIFLLEFIIHNYSQLNYDIDFARLIIKDDRKVKRSSVQEQEIISLYTDPVRQIDGQQKASLIVAVPQFTIPDKKTFLVQLFEKNGGRNLTLTIKNRQLLKARTL